MFYIGKNDFWTRHPANAKVINVGRVELNIPALLGASYRQEQDLADKATRRRIHHWGQIPRKCGRIPHLSGARGIGQILGFDITRFL